MKRIRQLRGSMSQEEFSKILGVSQRVVSNIELGIRRPSVEDLIKLADFFGVSVDYLLERTDEKQPGEKIVSTDSDMTLSLNDPERRIVEYYRSLSAKAKRTLLQIVILSSSMTEDEKKEITNSIAKSKFA